VAASTILEHLPKFTGRIARANGRFFLFALLCGGLSGVTFAETAVSQDPPSGAEQDKLLDAMQAYAEQYVSRLPNFLCMQVTRQFEAGRKSKHWSKGDTLTSKLSFNQGHEQRTLELVNGKQVKPGRKRWRTPLVTESEFGTLLGQVLGDNGTAFTWSRWDTLRGRRVAVFDYIVDKQHSTLTLSLSDLVKAVIPYHGSVYADPANGTVWRISDTSTEIPPALETREISTTVEYNEIQIGGAQYLLPLQATVSLLLDRKKIRNEIAFQDYRKFEADSEITFGPGTASEGDQLANPQQQTTTPEKRSR
jgi:hypothetical protein